MDAQKIAVDAIVALTDCDREQVTAFIRRLYLAGVRDPAAPHVQGLAGDGAGLTAAAVAALRCRPRECNFIDGRVRNTRNLTRASVGLRKRRLRFSALCP